MAAWALNSLFSAASRANSRNTQSFAPVTATRTAEDPWALKWIDQNTAGFGAYHLQALKSGEEAVFIANPNYFAGKPYYDRVVYK